jgi:D-aminopeptidase
MGLARGGSYASNGSGEQLLAFSIANAVPLDGRPYTPTVLADGNESWQVISSVFKATIEATEEAVLNALLASHTTTGRDGNTLHALPVDRLLGILGSAGRIP